MSYGDRYRELADRLFRLRDDSVIAITPASTAVAWCVAATSFAPR